MCSCIKDVGFVWLLFVLVTHIKVYPVKSLLDEGQQNHLFQLPVLGTSVQTVHYEWLHDCAELQLS